MGSTQKNGMLRRHFQHWLDMDKQTAISEVRNQAPVNLTVMMVSCLLGAFLLSSLTFNSDDSSTLFGPSFRSDMIIATARRLTHI